MYLIVCGCFLTFINVITEALYSKVHIIPYIHGPSLIHMGIIKYVKNKLARQ